MLTCPFCGRVSHNPHDAAQRYCGACHVFIDDEIARRRMREALTALDATVQAVAARHETMRALIQQWQEKKNGGPA